MLGGTSALGALSGPAEAQGAAPGMTPTPEVAPTRLDEVPLASGAKLSVERRGQVVLLGINRPANQNRVDPETFELLAEAYYRYNHDPSLRAAVLFGHGEQFSRGIDIDGFRALGNKTPIALSGTINPLATTPSPRLTKPLVAVAHGDTWDMGHELFLVGDIRVAAADTRFGQDENTHGRFPGGGSTVRFVREAGWGNAMRYILTGDHWSAEEAYRMGTVQAIAPDAKAALELAVQDRRPDRGLRAAGHPGLARHGAPGRSTRPENAALFKLSRAVSRAVPVAGLRGRAPRGTPRVRQPVIQGK